VPVVLLALVAAMASCALPTRPPAPARPLASPQELPGLPNFARISPALYRGGQPTREGFERLKQMGVRTIVDLRGQIHREPLEGLDLKYVHVPSDVAHPDEQKIAQFLRIVGDPANQPVFVHGTLGAHRTGCYVAAYRIVEQRWSARDAELEMRRFHFSPYWKGITDFLNALDPLEMRERIRAIPPTTRTSR